jgi:TRAP-type mannitol/chloroaromatic compound transport system substrate-binding protein
MNRRDILRGTTLAAAAAAFPAPALAQPAPKIQWRLASSYPRSLDTLYGASVEISQRVAAATDGAFDIRVYAGGEIVPGLQVLDAVQAGTVQCGHTASYFYVGKDPSFAFDTAIPFGLNTRQHNAWVYQGGGMALLRDLFKSYNVVNFPAANTGCQMGGWYRKEIKTVEDLKGLKMRIGGFAGQVVSRLGVIPQQIAGGDLYPALERGTIDAVEWSGPYDDEKLGFHKVAPHYYYPGWWEGTANVSLLVNLDEWNKLPKRYQAILDQAATAANVSCTAKYDVLNPPAAKRLISAGAKFHAFPREVMEASYRAASDLYDETSAKNPQFAKLYQHYRQFRDEEFLWWRIAEFNYDHFVLSHR